MTSSESSRLSPRIVPQFEASLTPLSQLPPKQQKLAKAAMKSELNVLFKSVMGAQRDLKATSAALIEKPIVLKKRSLKKKTLTEGITKEIDGLKTSSDSYKARLKAQMGIADSDPKLASQMRQITFEIEVLEKRIKTLEALKDELPAVTHKKPKSFEKDARLALDPSKSRAVAKKSIKRTRSLDALLSRVNAFAKKFDKELDRDFTNNKKLENKDVNRQIELVSKSIQLLNNDLKIIEGKAESSVHLWDKSMRTRYHSHANRVKEKIQELQAKQAAFITVFGDATREVFTGSDAIHSLLKDITSKNAGHRLAAAWGHVQKIREAIDKMDDSKRASLSGALVLETFRAAIEEINLIGKPISLTPEQKRIYLELLKPHTPPGAIRDVMISLPGHRSDIPTVIEAMSSQLAMIARLHDEFNHPEPRQKIDERPLNDAIEKFEIMRANLGPHAEKVLADKQLKELCKTYERTHHAKIAPLRAVLVPLAKCYAALDAITSNQAADKIGEAMKAVKQCHSQLVGVTSHEIRTAVAAAIVQLNSILADPQSLLFTGDERNMFNRLSEAPLTKKPVSLIIGVQCFIAMESSKLSLRFLLFCMLVHFYNFDVLSVRVGARWFDKR